MDSYSHYKLHLIFNDQYHEKIAIAPHVTQSRFASSFSSFINKAKNPNSPTYSTGSSEDTSDSSLNAKRNFDRQWVIDIDNVSLIVVFN